MAFSHNCLPESQPLISLSHFRRQKLREKSPRRGRKAHGERRVCTVAVSQYPGLIRMMHTSGLASEVSTVSSAQRAPDSADQRQDAGKEKSASSLIYRCQAEGAAHSAAVPRSWHQSISPVAPRCVGPGAACFRPAGRSFGAMPEKSGTRVEEAGMTPAPSAMRARFSCRAGGTFCGCFWRACALCSCLLRTDRPLAR